MLSLYIHVPFCVRKCHYCGFYSTVYSEQAADDYLRALRTEWQRHQSAFQNRTFETVYIGGGTPSVLSPGRLETLLSFIGDNLPLDPGAEWTIEANPNSLPDDRLHLLRSHGVNRLSLGIQSFSDELLRFLGRPHTAADAAEAFLRARDAGFGNISTDLIYGIPGQSAERWQETVQRVIALGPDHISVYSLSLDAGSRFRTEADAGRLHLPDDAAVAEQYESGAAELEKAGYEQYEISNFSLPGYACRHNRNYWQRGEYLGLGPSAWSFIGDRRYRNTADAGRYCSLLSGGSSVIQEEEIITDHEAANEKVMLALRTTEGLDLAGFEREYGRGPAGSLTRNVRQLGGSGLIEQIGSRLRLTRSGFLVENEVVTRLFR